MTEQVNIRDFVANVRERRRLEHESQGHLHIAPKIEAAGDEPVRDARIPGEVRVRASAHKDAAGGPGPVPATGTRAAVPEHTRKRVVGSDGDDATAPVLRPRTVERQLREITSIHGEHLDRTFDVANPRDWRGVRLHENHSPVEPFAFAACYGATR